MHKQTKHQFSSQTFCFLQKGPNRNEEMEQIRNKQCVSSRCTVREKRYHIPPKPSTRRFHFSWVLLLLLLVRGGRAGGRQRSSGGGCRRGFRSCSAAARHRLRRGGRAPTPQRTNDTTAAESVSQWLTPFNAGKITFSVLCKLSSIPITLPSNT